MTALVSNKFHGDPCPRGCGTERYLSGGQCCNCVRLAAVARAEMFKAVEAAAKPILRLVPAIPPLVGRFVNGPWRACPLDMCPFCGTTVADAMDRGAHIHACRQAYEPKPISQGEPSWTSSRRT